jgi:hypothetical protein
VDKLTSRPTFDVHFSWSPSTGRVKATYRAEIERHEPEGNRYLCKLIELVETSGLQSGSELTLEILHGLVGKHLRVPQPALDGVVLPLKMSTLTGGLRRPYFFDGDTAEPHP